MRFLTNYCNLQEFTCDEFRAFWSVFMMSLTAFDQCSGMEWRANETSCNKVGFRTLLSKYNFSFLPQEFKWWAPGGTHHLWSNHQINNGMTSSWGLNFFLFSKLMATFRLYHLFAKLPIYYSVSFIHHTYDAHHDTHMLILAVSRMCDIWTYIVVKWPSEPRVSLYFSS